ncbi:hypothetical protein GCM10009756_12590 [Pseudokineococcus marinus]
MVVRVVVRVDRRRARGGVATVDSDGGCADVVLSGGRPYRPTSEAKSPSSSRALSVDRKRAASAPSTMRWS